MGDDSRRWLVREHNIRRQDGLTKGPKVLLVRWVDLKTSKTTWIELLLEILTPARIAKTLLIAPVQVI